VITGPDQTWYIADQKAGGILVYNADGIRTKTIARNTPGATGFVQLTRLASDGKLVYALDIDAKNITVFDQEQAVVTWKLEAGDRPVAMTYHDNLVYLLLQNGMVRALDKKGDVARVIQPAATRFPTDSLGYASGIAIDTTGEIYVTYPDREMIARHTGVGVVALRHARTWTWRVYAADAANHVYSIDRDTNRIVTLDSDGWRTQPVIPAKDSKITLDSPTMIAAHPNGNAVIVYDEDIHKVNRFDLANNTHLVLGSKGSGNGQFNITAGIAMDEQGRTFVLDTFHCRVAVFSETGEFLLNVGRNERGDQADLLRIPRAFCISPDGTQLFIYDEESQMIKHFLVDYETKQIRHLYNIGGAKEFPGLFVRVTGMGCDRRGRLYVLDYKRGDLQIFDSTALSSTPTATIKGSDINVRRMLYLALNPNGLVFIIGGDQMTGLHWIP
jgi:DNA-binding beta-propeller fold protein YncE